MDGPIDEKLNIGSSWTERIDGLAAAAYASAGMSFRGGRTFAFAARDWPLDEPLPVFTAVPIRGVHSANELASRVESFLKAAAESAFKRRAAGSMNARKMPLIALPFFGTAAGGGDLQRGEIMHVILNTIRRELPLLKCDVVLVLHDEAAFALAQDLRRRDGNNAWSTLSHEQLEASQKSC